MCEIREEKGSKIELVPLDKLKQINKKDPA